MGSCSRRREYEDSQFPGFYKCIDDSVLQNRKLKIPHDFCEGLGGKVPLKCFLQNPTGNWPVDVKDNSGELFLEKGWNGFSVGNRLKLGDFVVFHYIEHAKFFVEIYGHNHCSKMSKAIESDRLLDDHDVITIESDSDSEPQNKAISLVSEIESSRGSSSGKLRRNNILAGLSSSGNPCFSVEMCQTHITKGPLLTPRSFMRNLHKPKKVKLQIGNKAWKVKWIHTYERSSRFSGGWLKFVGENRLQKGDACNFEMISKTNKVAVMKVSIRRMYG